MILSYLPRLGSNEILSTKLPCGYPLKLLVPLVVRSPGNSSWTPQKKFIWNHNNNFWNPKRKKKNPETHRNTCYDVIFFGLMSSTSPNHRWELLVFHYQKIMEIQPCHFLVVITQLFFWIIFINECVCTLTRSPEFYMVICFIWKIGGNNNSSILST